MANIIRVGGGGDSGAAATLTSLIERTIAEVSSDEIEKVGANAFYYCPYLAAVSLPAATSVGDRAFYDCPKLATVNLPAAKSIGDNAFYSCGSLLSISLPAATSLNESAFLGCLALATADLSAATSIGSRVFSGCSALAALVLRRTSGVCTLGSYALYSTAIAKGTGYIYVPDSLVASYKAATNWSTYANQIKPLSEYTG